MLIYYYFVTPRKWFVHVCCRYNGRKISEITLFQVRKTMMTFRFLLHIHFKWALFFLNRIFCEWKVTYNNSCTTSKFFIFKWILNNWVLNNFIFCFLFSIFFQSWINNNTDRTLDVVFSRFRGLELKITLRQRLSLSWYLTLPARNFFGLLPQGYCEQKNL